MEWSGLEWAEMDFFMQNSMIIYKCWSVKPDPRNKISRSHYKILSKLTEICWRWLSMTRSYSVQSSMARDGNGYEISAYPRIPNPTGADTGLSLCPRVRVRVQL